jgi:Peptidyl-tRNA hydrolase PTH2
MSSTAEAEDPSVSGRSSHGTATAATTHQAPTSTTPPSDATPDPIVQYIIIRKDLWTAEKWPLGALAAQACHASSAAIWESKDDPDTQAYLAPSKLNHMRKVRFTQTRLASS